LRRALDAAKNSAGPAKGKAFLACYPIIWSEWVSKLIVAAPPTKLLLFAHIVGSVMSKPHERDGLLIAALFISYSLGMLLLLTTVVRWYFNI
jgi:hypothetical protein